MKDNQKPFPIAGILGLIFITLKLIGIINWSWVWVLAPFWIPLAVVLIILAVTGLMVLIDLKKIENNKR